MRISILRQSSNKVPKHNCYGDSSARHCIEASWNWEEQYEAFMNADFNVGYKPDEHECFCMQDYDLPDWLDLQ